MNNEEYENDFGIVDDCLYVASFELWHIDGDEEKALHLIDEAIEYLTKIKNDVRKKKEGESP